MDDETRDKGWTNYENVRRNYYLQGNPLHWVLISLYVCCTINEKNFNPISIDRLLKYSTDLTLKEFFSQIDQWSNMTNLNSDKRKKFQQIEKSFSISSIVYSKYPKLFSFLSGENPREYLHVDFQSQRKISQLNRKFHRNKSKEFTFEDLYSLGWTMFALSKTLYPTIFFDLTSSFHLLISTIQFLFDLQAKFDQNDYSSENEKILSLLCHEYDLNEEICLSIYEEHYLGETFWKNLLLKSSSKSKENHRDRNEFLDDLSKEINRCYDEIVLTNCFLDERIFLNQSNRLIDDLSIFNENSSQISIENKTPLTAEQHFLCSSPTTNRSPLPPVSHNLTPLSLRKHFIDEFMFLIESKSDPMKTIENLLQNQKYFDHLNDMLKQWKTIYDVEYNRDLASRCLFRNVEEKSFKKISERYFDLSLKFFYRTFENLIRIEEKKRLGQNESGENVRQAIEKLILNNEFVKSLLSLSLLIVFYVHRDDQHDYQWIFTIYSINSYSFLKIIQIFLKTRQDLQQIRSIVKYLSKIEEIILSSLVWKSDSTFWIDLHRKGFLEFNQIYSSTKSIHSTPHSTQLYLHSPIVSNENVSRKLFHSNPNPSTTSTNPFDDEKQCSKVKSSPYTMFFRKFYQLVLYRFDSLIRRLGGNDKTFIQNSLWSLFNYLLKNYFEKLFSNRHLDQIILSTIFFFSQHSNQFVKDSTSSSCHPLNWIKLIQIYGTIPNANRNILRSVYLYPLDDRSIDKDVQFDSSTSIRTECLTPSKPAGTKTSIDGIVYGDITNFYHEIFLQLEDFPSNFFSSLDNPSTKLFYPSNLISTHQHSTTEHLSIQFSSTNEKKSIDKRSSPPQTSSTSSSSSSNHYSTLTRAGLKSRVQTTRIRTDEGKFLTTISTINDQDKSQDEHLRLISIEKKFFGQIDSSLTLKRSISTDSNVENRNCLDPSSSSTLTSLRRKVFIIENDRNQSE